MNPIVVHKYGGSSLATLDKVRAVAGRIAATVAQGKRVVAVVSAMGKATDKLLADAKALSDNPNPRELDMLLSVGERISTAMLAIALDELGLPAVSFTGSQSGIITNARHNRARIVEVRPFRVLDELDAGKVVIVAGYQGVSYAREITTLGRGGTDTTAVAMAAALGAEYCEICSDVDGVYTADPRIVSDARRLDEVTPDEMLALARHGARVLNQDCVQYASRHGVAVFAKATFGPRDDAGTVVRTNAAREPRPVTAIAHRTAVAELTLAPGGDVAALLSAMTACGAFPTTLEGGGPSAPATVALALEDSHRLGQLRGRLEAELGDRLTWRQDRGTVTAIGHGLGEEPGVLQAALSIGRELTGGPVPACLGPLALTLTLPSPVVDEAVARLHQALLGEA
jgi:aspartate kinase